MLPISLNNKGDKMAKKNNQRETLICKIGEEYFAVIMPDEASALSAKVFGTEDVATILSLGDLENIYVKYYMPVASGVPGIIYSGEIALRRANSFQTFPEGVRSSLNSIIASNEQARGGRKATDELRLGSDLTTSLIAQLSVIPERGGEIVDATIKKEGERSLLCYRKFTCEKGNKLPSTPVNCKVPAIFHARGKEFPRQYVLAFEA
jgi:hypothetical protein